MREARPTTSRREKGAENSNCRRASPGSAFTLIELLITIALILVLTTMLWRFRSPSNQRRKELACLANLQKIHIAMEIYARDSGGGFPAAAGARSSEEALDALVPHYTVDTSIFICPGSKDLPIPSGESLRKQTISYAYYMGRRLSEPPEAAPEPLMSDRQIDTKAKVEGDFAFSRTGRSPGNNHNKNGGAILFTDGHVELTPPGLAFSLPITPGVVLLNPKRQAP